MDPASQGAEPVARLDVATDGAVKGPHVSAVVYSRNEAHLLDACLSRLSAFDEVVVCDMGSTDETRDVAARHRARVVAVPDARVVEEVRQRGLDSARSEWVFFVDADEHVPDGFIEHVRAMVATDSVVAWRLRYTDVAFGRVLEHTLQGNAKYALFRRGAVHYRDPRAHVPPQMDGAAADAPPHVPPVLHLNHVDVAKSMDKALRYGPDLPTTPALLHPFGLMRQLAREVVFSGAWRDGRAGVVVATLGVLSRWYGTVLLAERRGELGMFFGGSELRALALVTRAQRRAVRLRDRLRAAAGKQMRGRS